MAVNSPSSHSLHRLKLLRLLTWVGFLAIIGRLFYWQMIKGPELRAFAQDQYTGTSVLQGSRGRLYTHDGYLLVGNQPGWQLFAHPNQINQDQVGEIAQQLSTILN